MNEISASGRSVLEQLRPQQPEPTEEELGKTAFLELMVAQLEHQDPLNPQENGDFIAQLAQFSSVEGIQNLNNSFDTVALSLRSSMTLQASTLVGRAVRVPTSGGIFNGTDPVAGNINLPASTADLSVQVTDGSGTVVRRFALGAQAAGDVPLQWDGTDVTGTQLPPGRYEITATATIGGDPTALQVEMDANVDSVIIAASGEVLLNVAGVGQIPMNDVREIR